jgi:hypothetical protein
MVLSDIKNFFLLICTAALLAACGGLSENDSQKTAVPLSDASSTQFVAATALAAETWTSCAKEDGVCSFTGTAQVRFGLNGTYAYKTATGSIGCNIQVFGDPLPGADKICEYSPVTSTPTSPVAGNDSYSVQSGQLLSVPAPGVLENDSLGSSGAAVTVVRGTQAAHGTVAVNASGSFTYQPVQGYAGSDSFTYTISNASGQESTATVALTVTSVPPPSGTWTSCAKEDGVCSFTGTAQVRFGLNGTYAYKTATGSIGCNIQVFGDPLPGADKICEYSPVTSTPTSPYGQDPSLYQLTFQDEFDGNSLNLTKWNTHLWYEDEPGLKNYEVSNGSLKIWLKKNSRNQWVEHNRTFDTDGKFEQTYGFFEMEAKFPVGPGPWAGFWLYAHPGDDRPEIDIVEVYSGGGEGSGWSDNYFHPLDYGMTLHKANADYSMHEYLYWGRMRDISPYENGTDLSASFHRYAVKWEPSGVTFYLDGKQIGPKHIDTEGYYSKPMYTLLSLYTGINSTWNKPTRTTVTSISNSMEVNYVRVWQLK